MKLPDEIHLLFEGGLFLGAFVKPEAAERLRDDRERAGKPRAEMARYQLQRESSAGDVVDLMRRAGDGRPVDMRVALLEGIAAIERLSRRCDGHTETLRGIASMDPATEGERMQQWARDGLSGYTGSTKSAIKTLMDGMVQAEKQIAALCEVVREQLDGDCGCHLLAPQDCPCVVCEAEATLPTKVADCNGNCGGKHHIPCPPAPAPAPPPPASEQGKR